MPKRFKYCFILFSLLTIVGCGISDQPTDLNAFSQHFLKDARDGKDCSPFIDTLKKLDPQKFTEEIDTDDEKLAFWLNTYNALIIVKLKEDKAAYADRDRFFGSPSLQLFGLEMSFDEIEQEILHAGKGSSETQKLSLKKPDHRIHFALNCGARSCPPIAYYSPDEIQEQLALAERSFIESNSHYNSESNVLTISEIFKWYSEDFGGEEGILQLHKKIGIIPPWAKPAIKLTLYDWQPVI